MDKKNKGYTSLSDVDHKIQFVNLLGIINEITPVIKRNKMLGSVVVEINDATMSNPGFVTTINLDSEVLDQFLAVAKKGLIIECLDMKVAKNDGEIRGEVWEEEEVRLHKLDGSRLKWWNEEKKFPNPDKVKRAIGELVKWNRQIIKGSPEMLKSKENTQKKSLTNELLALEQISKSPSLSRRKTIAASDRDIFHAGSPKDQDKNKRVSAVKRVSNTKTEIPEKRSPRDLSKDNMMPDKPIQIIDGKHKLVNEKSQKRSVVSQDTSQKKRSTISRESITGVTDGSFEPNKSVTKLTSEQSSVKSNNKSKIQDHTKAEIIGKKLSLEKADEIKNKRTAKKNVNVSDNDSSLNTGRETRLRKQDSPVDIKSSKSSPVTNKLSKEKLKSRLSKHNLSPLHHHLLTSSSSSIDSNKSVSSELSESLKNKAIKSQKEFKKGSKRSHSIETQKKSLPLTEETNNTNCSKTQNISLKTTRSSNSPNKSQDKKSVTKKDTIRYSTPLQSRFSNSSFESIDSPSNSLASSSFESPSDRSRSEKQSNLNKKITNTEPKITKNQEMLETSQLHLQNRCKSPKKRSEDPGSILEQSKNLEPKNMTTVKSNIKSLTPKLSNGSTDQEEKESSKKLGRQSINNSKDIKNKKDIMSFLSLLTRKVHLDQVQFEADISNCEIEEIDVPEKIDLQCKILSQFYLFEDNIQVVRVQDGTIAKSPTLIIPEKHSWEEIVATIMKSPIVKKNSPYIDIIIFDAHRLDKPAVSGKCYELHNVMAIKLNLKDDPRARNKAKGELFFCAKGADTYIKYVKPQERTELIKKLNEENYKKLCAEFLDKEVTDTDKSDENVQNKPPSPKKQKLADKSHEEQVETNLKEKSSEKSIQSPTNKKRKLPEIDFDNKDSQTSATKSRKVDEEDSRIKNKMGTPNIESIKTKSKNVTIPSTDETMLGETECLIVKELSEIMHEESLLGLPQTYTEDVHLKNSGSEVTFSQFCDAAKAKGANFRTSTQAETLSEDIIPLNGDQDSPTVDSSKMEPLVYCPSGSSLSDSISPKKQIKSAPVVNEIKECSESILQNYTMVTDGQTSSPKAVTIENEKIVREETSTRSSEKVVSNDSVSVEVISSNSSELEFEVIKSKVNAASESKTKDKHFKETDQTKASLNLEEDKSLRSTEICSKTCENELQSESANNYLGEVIEENNSDKLEIMSVSNSTSVSDLYLSNNTPSVVCEKSSDVSPNKISQEKIEPRVEWSGFKEQCPLTEEQLQKIPDSCCYKSTRKPFPSTEGVSDIHNDENQPLKYFSYSHDQSLPFLTFDDLRKLKNKNYVTAAVTIESISPSLTESWENDCIKSHCPCCNKLYNAYNALNNKFSENSNSLNALCVRGLIVCPESQCCNQVLDSPEFHFSVDTKLKDSSPVTALLAGSYAEEIFGCKPQEAARDKTMLNQVRRILEKVITKISEKQSVKVDFARENICNPKSGPLYIKTFHF